MRATIDKVTFKDEREGKYGKQYSFEIAYSGKTAYYTSKSKEQTKFKEGQEAEFTEETRTSKAGKPYLVVKPIYQGASNYARALTKEQARYSGFAMSYAKDLVVSGKVELKDIEAYTRKMFTLMVELDNSIK